MKKNKTQRFHLPSVIQFFFSLAVALFYGAAAFSLPMLGFMGGAKSIIFRRASFSLDEFIPLMLISAGFAWLACLMLPSVYYAGKRVFSAPAHLDEQEMAETEAFSTGNREHSSHTLTLDGKTAQRLLIFTPLLFISVLSIGKYSSEMQPYGQYLLPFLHILGISLPILWFFSLGAYRLHLSAQPRFWGVLANSLSLTPFIILILESIVLVLTLIVMLLWLALSLGTEHFTSLIQSLEQVKDTQQVLQSLSPLLAQPSVLISTLVLAAILVPLLEEALKPLGIWLIYLNLSFSKGGNKTISEGEGFGLGLLCGSGYALFESLFLASTQTEWTIVAASRAAASLLHVVHGGLMGWAAAVAFNGNNITRKKRVGGVVLLLLVYMGVVFTHGLWNGMTLLAVFSELSTQLPEVGKLPLVLPLGRAAPWVLGGLIVWMLMILLFLNTHLRKKEMKSVLLPNDLS